MILFGLLFVLLGMPAVIAGLVAGIGHLRGHFKDIWWFFVIFGCLFGGGSVGVGTMILLMAGDLDPIADHEAVVACTATVLDIDATHTRINGDRVYAIRARVGQADDGQGVTPVTVDVRSPLDPLQAGRIGAGTRQFACTQATSDPERVEIDWNHPQSPTPTPAATRR
ncbi:hypothetical protein GCM10010411_87910 [Actinomadura fulvescens]|uniref:Uncharacterized protein n=1 Tax=Actinomadura fulvescens TaxID=46160 RepID=A0ABN3QU60_9ACTN